MVRLDILESRYKRDADVLNSAVRSVRFKLFG
jgi:hypothetical protein